MDRSLQVDAFVRSRLSGSAQLTVPPHLRPKSNLEGYEIQGLVHEELERRGNRLTGYKVGCATDETRRPFGIDEPTYGGILATTARPDLANALSRTEGRFAIECEIAMRIGRDVRPGEIRTITDAHACIDACAVGCELVQNRYGDPVALGVPTLVADDFLHYAYVLGAWQPSPQPDALGLLRARLWLDDELVSQDFAATVMGNPLQSVVWLSSAVASSGRTLRKGDVILTGSIVAPRWVDRPPRQARLDIDLLQPLGTDSPT